jgi:EAL domain-containing protein (putative c-di-GMP-specific phosphodiesterase class I)/PAS domain-containing protein
LRHFLNSNDNFQHNPNVTHWQVSALRLMLITVLLISTAITSHSFYAYVTSLTSSHLNITSAASTIVLSLLFVSRKYYFFSAHVLLLTITVFAIYIHLFMPDIHAVQISATIAYVTPVIALLLIGRKTAACYTLLNLLPLYIIFRGLDAPTENIHAQLIHNTYFYIHSFIFFFFNICIPLAVWRTSLAAMQLQQKLQQHSTLLEKQKNLYRKFFQNAYSAIILVNEQQEIVEANQKAKQLLNLYHHPLPCHSKLIFDHAIGDSGQLYKRANSILQIDAKERHEKSLSAWYISDASEQFHLQQQFKALGAQHHQTKYFNTRVNLPNKTWLIEQIDIAVKGGAPFIVAIAENQNLQMLEHGIDAEQRKLLYKHINKIFEHHSQANSAVAYLGSGRIGFIAAHNKILINAVKQWQQNLDFWLRLGNLQYHAKYAVSIAAYPQHGYSAERLLNNAIQACELRHSNALYSVFDFNLKKQRLGRHEMALLLEKALEQDELEIYLQGKHFACGRLIGFEALTRWHSHLMGKVPAGEFIAIAEEFGLIEALTQYIICKLCRTLADYPALPIPIAVNVSAQDLQQEDFAQQIKTHLQTYNLTAGAIELELTEYSIASDRAHTLMQLKSLNQFGIKLAIDDFGTGYSNIARLIEYPINRLKFDRSLLNKIDTDKNQYALLSGMVKICAKLGIAALAEGVETTAQRDALAKLGMQEYQGYLYSTPQPIKEVLSPYVLELQAY